MRRTWFPGEQTKHLTVMGSANLLKNLIAEFGASIGIPELTLDEENRCNLMFDEVAVSFELSPDEDAVYIYAYLGDVVRTGNGALFTALLGANYLFKGTRGATIGVDEASGRVVMIRSEDLSALRLSRFSSLVEEFINLAELWQKKLAEFPAQTTPEPAPATPVEALTTKV